MFLSIQLSFVLKSSATNLHKTINKSDRDFSSQHQVSIYYIVRSHVLYRFKFVTQLSFDFTLEEFTVLEMDIS